MTTLAKKMVDIYRSKKKEGMYLYLNKGEKIEQLPEGLQQAFGRAEFAFSLLLHSQRKLANADIHKVMQALQDTGFYLQLPPTPEVNAVIDNPKLPLA